MKRIHACLKSLDFVYFLLKVLKFSYSDVKRRYPKPPPPLKKKKKSAKMFIFLKLFLTCEVKYLQPEKGCMLYILT